MDNSFDVASRHTYETYGIVSAVDPVRHAVKVRVQPEDVETGWIPDTANMRAGSMAISCPCEVGQHVTLTAIDGVSEQWKLTTSQYDDSLLPPKSPLNNKPAQPGEALITGKSGAWAHILPAEVHVGVGTSATIAIASGAIKASVGNAALEIKDGSIVLTVGGAAYTFDDSAFTTAQDVQSGGISVKEHYHRVTGNVTTAPAGND